MREARRSRTAARPFTLTRTVSTATPLGPSTDRRPAPARDAPSGPRPGLGFRDVVGMVVGIVIGAGIFRTPSLVAANAGGPEWMLGAWVLGGFVSLVGALPDQPRRSTRCQIGRRWLAHGKNWLRRHALTRRQSLGLTQA